MPTFYVVYNFGQVSPKYAFKGVGAFFTLMNMHVLEFQIGVSLFTTSRNFSSSKTVLAKAFSSYALRFFLSMATKLRDLSLSKHVVVS